MTAAPAGTRKPADRKPRKGVAAKPFDVEAAAKAAAAEATGEPFRFKMRRKTFTIPMAAEWPIEVSDHLARNELASALELMLGDEEWARFIELRPRPNLGEVNAIVTGIGEWAGVETAGN